MSLFIITLHVLLLLLFCSCTFMTSGSSTSPRCHDDDLSALVRFKNSFTIVKETKYGDPVDPTLESWNVINGSSSPTSNCCSWDGVECDAKTGHVIALGLSKAGLHGSINSSSSLFDLLHLQRLDLSKNDFDGSEIPYRFGVLSSLMYLNLSDSGFSGEIPSSIFTLVRLVSLNLNSSSDKNLLQLKRSGFSRLIHNLTNLQELCLDHMYIPSPVPDSIANMSSLTSLSFYYTTGLYGVLPERIFALRNLKRFVVGGDDISLTSQFPEFNTSSPLQELWLKGIEFANEIPESIGNLHSLTSLTMDDCQISGSLPLSIGNLTDLTYLYFISNPFDARNFSSLSWLWKLTKLVKLELHDINLQGEIPPSIGNLSNMKCIFLLRNQLSGSIPVQLMNLTHLEHLYLYGNQLSGDFPSWISNITTLLGVDFSFNGIRGTVPSSISQLQNLQLLSVHRTQLSGALDLDMFLNLKNLQTLQISSNNNLTCRSRNNTGSTELPQFVFLRLSSCDLRDFPSFLQGQQKLEWLDLSSNNIRGKVPEWFGKISINTLQYLNLSHNFLTGVNLSPKLPLPWKFLYALDLTSNMFHGPLPIVPTTVESYLVPNNNMTGNFPDWICDLRSLKFLDLSFNNLSGSLPYCMGNLSNTLTILNLQENRFDGSIPEFCASATRLQMISLRSNQLHGRLPRSLSNCSMLEFIDVSNNQINDTFPSWLEKLSELEVLILNNNNFHGVIEETDDSSLPFPKLRITDISHNALSGQFPEGYFRAWSSLSVTDRTAAKVKYMEINCGYHWNDDMTYSFNDFYQFSMTVTNKGLQLVYPKVSNIFMTVDFSSNMFGGEIPDVIGSLQGIHSLNLSNNLLNGGIPSSMGNLAALESLDLSHNRLKGEIPEELAKLNFLSQLDVSYNDLTGMIPKGQQFNTFPESSFEGNLGLCGDVISKKCGGSGAEPNLFEDEEEDSGLWTKFEYIIVTMGYGWGLVIGVVLGNEFASRRHGCFAAFLSRKQRKGRATRIGFEARKSRLDDKA